MKLIKCNILYSKELSEEEAALNKLINKAETDETEWYPAAFDPTRVYCINKSTKDTVTIAIETERFTTDIPWEYAEELFFELGVDFEHWERLKRTRTTK